jgi:hypothetical protein
MSVGAHFDCYDQVIFTALLPPQTSIAYGHISFIKIKSEAYTLSPKKKMSLRFKNNQNSRNKNIFLSSVTKHTIFFRFLITDKNRDIQK